MTGWTAPPGLPEELQDALDELATWLQNPQLTTLQLAPLVHQPARVTDGLVVYWTGDTATWNPGSGEGVYCYYNAGWHYLG